MRKLFRFLLVLVALMVIAAVAVPILFKDQIFETVKKESNAYINGEVLIADMGLSLFRNFPNLTLSLDDLEIIGEGDFQGISLVKAGEIAVTIDLFSAFAGSGYELKSIQVRDADVYVLVLPDGQANYDIVKEREEELPADEELTEDAAYSLKLKDFRIKNMNLVYDDRQGDVYMKLDGLNHHLSGDFSAAVIDMNTETTVEAVEFVMNKISYLRKTTAQADIDLNYVTETGQLTLRDNSISLNGLILNASGEVVMGEENMQLDLQFNSPGSDFAQVLSLIPEVYYQDFEDIQTSGSFAMNAFVKGTLDDSESTPAFGLNLEVKNGSFSYPDLPTSAENINFKAAVSKPQGTTDAMVIDIPSLRATLAGQPLEARLNLKTPVSDPQIDLYLNTDMDLAEVARLVPQEDIDYQGRLVTDLTVKGRLSDFESQNTSAVEAGGTVELTDFVTNSADYALPLSLKQFSMVWTPQTVRVPTAIGSIGSSDFSGTGSLDNILSYVLSDTTLRGRFNLESRLLDLNELASAGGDDTEEATEEVIEAGMEVIRIPVDLDMDLQIRVDKVLYDDMVIEDTRGQITLVDGVAALNGFNMKTMGGTVAMAGSYDSRLLKPEVLFDFKLNNLDVGQAFRHMDMLRSFAPVAQNAVGQINISFNFNSLLNEDMKPDLATVIASGLLTTSRIQVKPDVMQKVATALNNDDYGQVVLGNTRLDFRIEEGRLSVKPFDVSLGRYKATVSGTSGLDQTLDYTMATELPINSIKVPDEIAELGLRGNVGVNVKFGGTMTNPTVGVDFGDITSGVRQQVQQVIQQQIDDVKQEVTDRLNEEGQKIMTEARAQAERIKTEAKDAADKIRSEARIQAQKLRDEAKKQADDLLAEAGSNPLKQTAARVAGDKLREEAGKKADALVTEADRRAQNLESEAAARADKIIAEAEEKAKVGGE